MRFCSSSGAILTPLTPFLAASQPSERGCVPGIVSVTVHIPAAAGLTKMSHSYPTGRLPPQKPHSLPCYSKLGDRLCCKAFKDAHQFHRHRRTALLPQREEPLYQPAPEQISVCVRFSTRMVFMITATLSAPRIIVNKLPQVHSPKNHAFYGQPERFRRHPKPYR